MKSIFKVISASLLMTACSSDVIDKSEAARIAQDTVSGEAGEVERGSDGGFDVWEVHVAMANGAEIEVKVEVSSGDVVIVEDKTGPFDYDSFTPIAGVLSYAAITEVALAEVAGTVEAWEFKKAITAGETELEWELYVRDTTSQLWEIKFDAATGATTALEMKDMVDP